MERPINFLRASLYLRFQAPRRQKVDSTLDSKFLQSTDELQDCLFLDVYVPAKAVENPSLKLPVIHWIFGGAYIFGSKDSSDPLTPFYDGTGLIQQSGGEVIFIASNYRVGLSCSSQP